ncbi:MAG: hypothetical protein IJ197_06100 [Bacteroidaceae bacterium]|nr:hypothetical protein [Bacteroidaceae bacterium]
MKRILFLLLVCSLGLTAQAGTKDKEARKVLDATAAHISKAGGIALQFTATSILGKTPQGSTIGTMDVQGRKFTIQSTDMLTWFDGRTQWSMQVGDTEVNMTEPTGTELQAMNPYAFLSIYKKGFNYKMKRGKMSNGKQGYRLTLTADNAKQEIREIFLEVDLQYNPVRVSMRQGKSQWMRLVVNSFTTGKQFPDSHFTFPKSQYPDAEIIDLR